jgi:septal ring factor EnvC (AmiA/AmiB activator)
MSTSPERRFATSPKHELLKKVFSRPVLTVSTSRRKSTSSRNLSLLEHKNRQMTSRDKQRVDNIEEQYSEMSSELNKTRERVDSISKKLDFLIEHLCKDTMFTMDDI